MAPPGSAVVGLGAATPGARVFPFATTTRPPTAATTLVFVSRGLQVHSKNQSYGTSIPNTRGAASRQGGQQRPPKAMAESMRQGWSEPRRCSKDGEILWVWYVVPERRWGSYPPKPPDQGGSARAISPLAIPLNSGWYHVSRWLLAGRVWWWFVALVGGSS